MRVNHVLAAVILALGLVAAAWLYSTRSVVVGGPAAYVYQPWRGELLYCDAGECYTVPPPKR